LPVGFHNTYGFHGTYLKVVKANPRVLGKRLEHGHQELQATIPVSYQNNQADQVQNSHDHARDA